MSLGPSQALVRASSGPEVVVGGLQNGSQGARAAWVVGEDVDLRGAGVSCSAAADGVVQIDCSNLHRTLHGGWEHGDRNVGELAAA